MKEYYAYLFFVFIIILIMSIFKGKHDQQVEELNFFKSLFGWGGNEGSTPVSTVRSTPVSTVRSTPVSTVRSTPVSTPGSTSEDWEPPTNILKEVLLSIQKTGTFRDLTMDTLVWDEGFWTEEEGEEDRWIERSQYTQLGEVGYLLQEFFGDIAHQCGVENMKTIKNACNLNIESHRLISDGLENFIRQYDHHSISNTWEFLTESANDVIMMYFEKADDEISGWRVGEPGWQDNVAKTSTYLELETALENHDMNIDFETELINYLAHFDEIIQSPDKYDDKIVKNIWAGYWMMFYQANEQLKLINDKIDKLNPQTTALVTQYTIAWNDWYRTSLWYGEDGVSEAFVKALFNCLVWPLVPNSTG
jgi:hypothetical protein